MQMNPGVQKGWWRVASYWADLGVAMLEQPLPAQDDAALENFIHPLPICADESCHTRSNLKALKGRYEMVNIKLDKTWGRRKRWRWRLKHVHKVFV